MQVTRFPLSEEFEFDFHINEILHSSCIFFGYTFLKI